MATTPTVSTFDAVDVQRVLFADHHEFRDLGTNMALFSKGKHQLYNQGTEYYAADGSNRFLTINSSAGDAVVSAPSGKFVVSTGSGNVTLDTLSVYAVGDTQYLDTSLSNFVFNKPFNVSSDFNITGNQITYGSTFTQNVNIWRDVDVNSFNRIGYAFNINSNGQMELLQYRRDSNNVATTNRVAIYGMNLNTPPASDSAYDAFDFISTTNGRSSSSNGGAGGFPALGTAVLKKGLPATQVSNYLLDVLFDSNNPSHRYGIHVIDGSAMRLFAADGTSLALSFATGSNTFTDVARFSNGRMDLTGDLHLAGSVVGFDTLSDERLKEHWVPMTSNLHRVCKLKPVEFDWRVDVFNAAKRGTHDVRLIAQEVEQVVPEATTDFITGDLKYKCVKYDKLVPLLIGAIQELQSRLEQVEGFTGAK
eukprot:jgi/Chrzof1/9263/UNPLg00230.t1